MKAAGHRRADPRAPDRLLSSMPRSSALPSAPASRSSRTSITSTRCPTPASGTWIVRGFGTALMHGGTTAIFAMMASRAAASVRERAACRRRSCPASRSPSSLHCGVQPPVRLAASSRRSPCSSLLAAAPVRRVPAQRARRRRLAGPGIRRRRGDAGVDQLRPAFRIRRSGKYLDIAQAALHGSDRRGSALLPAPLHRARASRQRHADDAREPASRLPMDEATAAKFAEMRYLERSIGKTGLLAVHADAAHEPQGPVAALHAREQVNRSGLVGAMARARTRRLINIVRCPASAETG